MDTYLTNKRIWIFLTFAVGIPWIAALVFYLSGMVESNPDQAVMLVNYVFISTPALANVATRLITREGWKHLWLRPKFRRGWKFYLAAWLLPLLAMIAGSLAYYLIFPQSFDPNVNRAREQIVIFTSAAVAGPWMVMLALTLEQMIVQGLFISVLAIGEEFGWRAYLLQKLTDRFDSARNAAVLVGLVWALTDRFDSARNAAVLVGLVWAVWHMPLLLMGLSVDPVFSSSRVVILFMLIYPISTISTSILLSWATLRSGSVWPAAIGHASELRVAGLAMGMLKGPINPLVSPNPQSLIGNLGFIALALVLYFNQKAFTREKEAGPQKVQAVVGV